MSDFYPLDVSANLATTLGHWDEAVRLPNTAIERDPLNAGLYWAEAAFRRVLQISPTFVSE